MASSTRSGSKEPDRITLCEPRAMCASAVEPGAVGEGRRVQDGVLGADLVDVGVVAVAGKEQVAVGQHGALGPAGGAAGVEQPGLGLWIGRRAVRDRARQQRRVVGGADGQDRRQRSRRHTRGRQALGELGARQAKPRLRVGHDPGHLARMQLAVERDGGQTGAPDRIERRQELRTVLHRQRHARAGPQGMTAAGARRRYAAPDPRSPA